MFYELVSMRSGTRIGDYDVEAALLGDVRFVVGLRGSAGIAGIGFGQVDAQGRRKILAEGKQLLERAERAALDVV